VRAAGPAALAAGLALAGCGGHSAATTATGAGGEPLPTAAVASARLEYYIAEDLREQALSAGLRGKLRVRSVRCVRRDRIHYVCRIRTTSSYSTTPVDTSVADAFYDPRTDQAGYDIRP